MHFVVLAITAPPRRPNETTPGSTFRWRGHGWITDALDALEGPILIDWCHTNEAGARAVAERIYERVKPTLTGIKH